MTVVACAESFGDVWGANVRPCVSAKRQKRRARIAVGTKEWQPTPTRRFLHVVTYKLLCVLFEHLVDLIEQVSRSALSLVAFGRVTVTSLEEVLARSERCFLDSLSFQS